MLEFIDITFPVKNPVLHSLSSRIIKSKMTAIIGPSGCGKTTLLKILSGRLTEKYAGKIIYNHKTAKKATLLHNTAYVHQDDILSEHLTVEETINFYEQLLNSKCEDYIGLNKIKTSKIGTTTAGISAGERKRLGILISLLEKKDIIFLDEPTSGLDILNALNLVKLLKEIEGTKICVIHQPSSEILFHFDDLIVMLNGQIVFEGDPKDIFKWFEELGLDCPQYTNPADFIFTHAFPMIEKMHRLDTNVYPKYQSNNFEEDSIEIKDHNKIKHPKLHNISFYKEFRLLFMRNWKISIRNKGRLLARLVQSTFTGIIIGLIYFETYRKDASIKHMNIIGLMYFVSNSSLFTSSMSSLPDLFFFQNLLEREYQSRYYRYHSHFFSKGLFDIMLISIHPIILIPVLALCTGYNNGCYKLFITFLTALLTSFLGYATALAVASIFPTLQLSNIILPAVILPLTILNGFTVDTTSLFFFLKPIQYISPTKYSLFVLVRNEIDFEILKDMNKDNFTDFCFGILGSMFAMIVMILVLFVTAFIFLKRKIKRRI